MCKHLTWCLVDVMNAVTAFVIVTQEGQGSWSLEVERKQVSEQSRRKRVWHSGLDSIQAIALWRVSAQEE